MREIRLSGSEGGGNGTTGPPYPYQLPNFGHASKRLCELCDFSNR
jgi:hypothetical protein